MIIKQSKKELYKDNCDMLLQIDKLVAKNIELVILQEQKEEQIRLINIKINDYNKRVDDASRST